MHVRRRPATRTGSLPAAYYALHKPPRETRVLGPDGTMTEAYRTFFADFKAKLAQDFQGALIRRQLGSLRRQAKKAERFRALRDELRGIETAIAHERYCQLVAGIGDYSPGEINPLPIQGHQLGVLVCYEVIFPELAREYVRQGSDLLLNITNDAWFGRSSAPWQHLAMARFRAIENRVWVARAANTGISAIITPSGRIVKQAGLFETAFLTGKVGLGARPGLYSHMGDIVPGTFLLISLLWLIQTRRRFL